MRSQLRIDTTKKKSPTVQKTNEGHAPALQINDNQSRVVASLDDQASLKKLAKCKPAFKLVLTKLLDFSYAVDVRLSLL
jgi:hypothetical protein